MQKEFFYYDMMRTRILEHESNGAQGSIYSRKGVGWKVLPTFGWRILQGAALKSSHFLVRFVSANLYSIEDHRNFCFRYSL